MGGLRTPRICRQTTENLLLSLLALKYHAFIEEAFKNGTWLKCFLTGNTSVSRRTPINVLSSLNFPSLLF